MDAEAARLAAFVKEEEQEQQAASSEALEADEVLDGDQAVKLSPEEAVLQVVEMVFMPCEMNGLRRTMDIWTPDNQLEFAKRLCAVLMKYSIGRRIVEWLQNGLGIEEIALIMFLGPLVRKTIDAVRADIEELRAAAAAAAQKAAASAD
ncbi:MAG TPA: hypothetical protein VK149_12535 [Sideroxyarcus sp.]|nr:hypothetical protein [Sideroxyarcus sp.]